MQSCQLAGWLAVGGSPSRIRRLTHALACQLPPMCTSAAPTVQPLRHIPLPGAPIKIKPLGHSKAHLRLHFATQSSCA